MVDSIILPSCEGFTLAECWLGNDATIAAESPCEWAGNMQAHEGQWVIYAKTFRYTITFTVNRKLSLLKLS